MGEVSWRTWGNTVGGTGREVEDPASKRPLFTGLCRTPLFRRGAFFLLFLSFFYPGACTGWSTRPLALEGMHRVYVPYFKNDTFFRRLEQNLTRAVIDRINERPDLVLVDEKSADLIIKGSIIDYRLSVLSEDENDKVIEGRAVMVVHVDILRAADGKVLRSAKLRDAAEYSRNKGQGPEDSRAQSLDVLSRKIVALLEEGF